MDGSDHREITEIQGGNKNEAEDVEFQDEPSDCMSMNKELPFCRFCWINETSEDNPLMSSCKCRGGV